MYKSRHNKNKGNLNPTKVLEILPHPGTDLLNNQITGKPIFQRSLYEQ